MNKMCLAIAVAFISLLSPSARAGENAQSFPSMEPFVVTTEREPINTVEPLYRAYVTVVGEKFSFFVPEKFRLGGDTAHGRLTISSLESDIAITFVFRDRVVAGAQELSREFFREVVTNRYPNGKIVEEFTRPILGRGAQTYDVEWKTAAGLMQKTRVAFVSTVAGTLELTVTGGIKKFSTAQANFNEVAGSLVAAVNGKLKVNHFLNVN